MRLPLRRISRSPFTYWAVVALLAGLTASTATGLVDRARTQSERYGHLRTAVTATHAVDAGTVLRAGDVTVRAVPAAFLPEGALGASSAAVGRTVVVPLFQGAAVVAENLAPEGLHGLAALLPPGTWAVAVPTGVATVALRRGDRVDVLATFDPPAPGEDPTFPVAEDALVVDVGAESAALAVSYEEARRVAFAMVGGTVTIVLTASARPVSPAPRPPPQPGTPRTAGTTSSLPPSAPTTRPPAR